MKFAEALGDAEGRTAKVLDAVVKEEISDSSSEYEFSVLCEGKNSPLSKYFHILENIDESMPKDWLSVIKAFPFFTPAYNELFDCALETDDPKTAEYALNLFYNDYSFNGNYKLLKKASKYLIENAEKKFSKKEIWPVVKAHSEKRLLGKKWYDAAISLKKDDPLKSFNALKNAAYHIFEETEEMPSFIINSLISSSKILKDKNLSAIFEEIRPKDKKEEGGKFWKLYEDAEKEYSESEALKDSVKPLFEAVKKNDADSVKKIISSGISPDIQEKETGRTALHYAAEKGFKEIAELLLENQVNSGIKMATGLNLPVHLAAYNGQTDIIKLLVSKGADIHAVNGRTETPLFLAAQNGHMETVKFLHSKGADLNQKNISQETPIIIAAYNDHDETVKYIAENGGNVNAKDYAGQTALHWAAAAGKTELVKFLIKKGADPKIKDDSNETAADWARKEYPEISAILEGKKSAEKKEKQISVNEEDILSSLAEEWNMPVKEVKKMDTFHAPYSDIKDESLQHLHLLPKLKTVTLLGCTGLTDAGMKFIAQCRGLEEAHLSGVPITDKGLEYLNTCSSLKKLWIDGTKVSRSGIKKISKLTKLEWIRLNGLSLIDSSIEELKSLKNIKYFEASDTDITDRLCKLLGTWKNLNLLDLSSAKISSEYLKELSVLKKLQTLRLDNAVIHDDIWKNISSLSALENLSVSGTKLTGKGASSVYSLKKLLHLNLNETDVSDENISEIASLKSLRVLELEKTKITDKSVPLLKTMKNLNALIITGTKISSSGKKALKAAMDPHVSFSW
ncbi:MAG TPA: ankyrin repeat domain-containing protein [Leptospiraceae bacterium]|nr:ankyrin repeat domain-containing protein [Leptospiraceae bacterium]HNF13886.1 ankyrin repeat domain-containing protein [Leptospiraceae bacterium]HNF22870.1 ankyrin repeat domain-containing protein [Leptospiraceae bacterium]HNH06964.1 ankyrin repeat domain-containing protein [Leptospiraceae bacterium]HNI95069.1 ankyrin repeat domain-containing protein [Leptospiraceae bacterium]